METKLKYLPKLFAQALLLVAFFVFGSNGVFAQNKGVQGPQDSLTSTSDTLKYPFSSNSQVGGLYLKNPKSSSQKVEYDAKGSYYIFSNKIGNYNITHPYLMNRKEYSDYVLNKSMRDYFKQKSDALDPKKNKEAGSDNLLPQFTINSKFFETVFGGNTIEIIPQGFASVDLGMLYQKIDNPQIPENNRSSLNFDFDQRIQLSVIGKIGDKLRLQTSYDTQATFNFQNQMKLEFTGNDDDIVKKIEMGNVSLPVKSSLIQGAQSLFGVKTKLQFGKTTVSGVFSEQKSETKTVTSEGGATVNNFEFYIDNYEENKHYFFSHHFFENYDLALQDLPFINSGINVTRVEVWTTNRKTETKDVRNIVGMMDLGEINPYNPNVTVTGSGFPDNSINSIDPRNLPSGVRDISQVSSAMKGLGLNESSDYVVLENARKLKSNEFRFDPRLGYISLNQALNADEVLGVAFQYTFNGKTYQVGEFSNDGVEAPNNIVVKLLKSTITNVKLPIWDLMMKNIYSMGAYQVSPEDFRMDILYANDQTGVPLNYLSDSPIKDEILLRIFNLDKLNKNGDPQPDGYFDFLNGVTIDSKNGKIIFPSAQPFGSYLKDKLAGDNAAIKKYVFQELYDSTKFVAQQQTHLNKFLLKGKYKSEGGGGIPLGAINVPRGSVTVTSGGRTLIEGVDYTVDYQLGSVKVINESLISSGAPISVSLENNSAFSLQTRRFMGLNVEHKFSDNFVMEGNILNLREKPLTQKVSYGVEPVNNTILGLSATFSDEAPFLSDFASAISFADRKVKSNISVTGEFAYLMPGSPSGINVTGGATSYIDDFESTQIFMDIKNISQWSMSSTPSFFPEASLDNSLEYGKNRANLAWYIIDPLFYGASTITPDHIKKDLDQLSSNSVRRVYLKEIFPQTEVPIGNPTIIPMFDLSYKPTVRGMYNFDADNVNSDGSLENPEDRWGGITRSLTTSNFEESNIEFIHVWMMDPFEEGSISEGGDLYFNLGSVSEDILRDGRKSFENGVPANGDPNELIETEWGLVPRNQSLIYSFDTNDDAVIAQDVGLNGMNSEAEGNFYSAYLNRVNGKVDPAIYSQILADPASDDYHHFRGTDFDRDQTSIIDRYSKFNGVEGNSVPASKSPESYPTSGTTLPDVEDLNKDQSMDRTESYFQYKVKIERDMEVGTNYIVDKKVSNVLLANGKKREVTWYQFKIPLSTPEDVVGGINDFRSIRFVRMFMTGFKDPIVLRMARLEFIRGEWRRYGKMFDPDEDIDIPSSTITSFEVSAVNLEENFSRTPIPYVTPPGIQREQLFNQTQVQQQNEQSLMFKVCDLQDGESRATFKNVSLDLRRYKRVKMFAHVEDIIASQGLRRGDLRLVVRMGSDFADNYYQYTIPLSPTSWGATLDTDIWPIENELNMAFSVWEDIKLERNSLAFDITKLYSTRNGDNIVGIKGNPNMSNIRSIVVGIENASGMPQCAEVWVNELRLSDFDERGGWAAAATVNANLADLGDVTFAGSMSTIGFGSLEKSVSQRSNEDVKQYDVATTVNIGKFTPKNWSLKVPMYYTRSETFKDPEFDPLNPDISFEKSLNSLATDEERQERIKISRDYTKRTSVSFTNVKKERKGKDKPKLYDVENISLSYSQSKTYHSDINTEYFIDNTYKGGIQYNYSSKPKNVQPFKKSKFVKSSDWFGLIEDLNFYYFPSKLSFQTDVTRRYNTEKFRNIESPDLRIDPMYNKNFMMNYAYSFTFDLTKNLKLDLNTRANNIVDEPFGKIDSEEQKDSIWTNVMNFGRPTHFHQNFNIGYKFPLKNIPALKWMDINVKYSADFDWQAGSLAVRNENMNLGNNLQNSNTAQLNGKLNFKKLYRMFGLGKSKSSSSRKPSSSNKPGSKSSAKSSSSFWDVPIDLVTMLKDITMSYSENNGTFLPGYLPEVGFFGQQDYNGSMAPSLGFMFGDQVDIRQTAVMNGWLTTDTRLNNAYRQTHTEKINFKATLEPLKELRIDLTATRNFSFSHSEFFRYVEDDVPVEGFYSQNPFKTGNFNITYFTLFTSFTSSEQHNSGTFNSLKTNRKVISNRLAQEYYGSGQIPVDPETGYPKGYGPNSQQVLIPSFLAAYSGKDAGEVGLQATRDVPIPNWSVTYTGLMRLPWFKDNFKNFTIAHAYRSAYSINSFTTNLEFDLNNSIVDKTGNYIGEYLYSNINIIEQFSPLIRIDMALNSNINIKTEMKKDRTVNLSMDNNMVTEILGQEYIVGFGYRVKDLKFVIRSKGKRRTIKSDLNLKIDMSYRMNRTFIRDLSEDNTQVTGGQNMTSIKASADYALSKRLSLKLYYDQNLTKYALSTAFPTSNARFGFSTRFNLGN
ncbi:MAG: cell surface protein SprA [Flavobacteriales bacterium]|nr:cell surface protein SprA [Flavobacteriales bacterium]